MEKLTVAEREAILSSWIKPSSEDEATQQARAERMVKEAIAEYEAFAGVDYRIYAKGSYKNNTNVRRDSDVDIVVQCQECIYWDYGPGVTPPSAGGSKSSYTGKWTPQLWRQDVLSAVVKKFGPSSVDSSGNIAIQIAAVPGSRPSIDVVPSFHYQRYDSADGSYRHDGSCVFPKAGLKIVNWPEQQFENGTAKNVRTGSRYKYFVRALKNSENVLSKSEVIEAKPSYFMECLVWNVKDSTLKTGTLEQGFRATLVELWAGLDEKDVWNEWSEPNDLKYLFRGLNKWTVSDARELVLETWKFLDY